MKRLSWLVPVVLASLMVCGSASADDARRREEARSRFDRAIALADVGDLDRALAEFQRAYELLPNPRVLLNIAETQASLGRAPEAVTSIERLLADPKSLNAEDLALAKALKTREEAKVATLSVTSNVPGSRIEVDNIAAGVTPLERPLRVSSGQRIVAVIAPGFAPSRKTVTLAGTSTQSLSFELVPLESRLAHLLLKANVPGATVSANGQALGTTPLATTLTLAPGHYQLELTRPGYVRATREVDLGEGATGEVRLDLEIDERELKGGPAGSLELAASEPNAAVVVDGKNLGVVTSARLPLGPHTVSVEKAGFERYERNVILTEGHALTLSPWLVPTADTRADYVSSAKRSRTIGWSLLIGGGVVTATSTVLAIVFTGKRSDAQKEVDPFVALASEGKKGVCDDVCQAQFDAASSKLSDAKSHQTIAFVGIGVGAAVMLAGGAFLFFGDDPHKYDSPPKTAWRMRPTFSPLQGGGAASVDGVF